MKLIRGLIGVSNMECVDYIAEIQIRRFQRLGEEGLQIYLGRLRSLQIQRELKGGKDKDGKNNI
jgi:hypothetical protein